MSDVVKSTHKITRAFCVGTRTIVCSYLGPAEGWKEGDRWGWTCPSCGTAHTFTRPTWAKQRTIVQPPIVPPTEAGEHSLYGVTFVIGHTGLVEWRSDCERCVRQGKGAFAPHHEASRGCRSGRSDHCACEGCF